MPKKRSRPSPKILLADGDPIRRETFRDLLARRGAEVVEAVGTDAARRAAERRPAPDLALVDFGSFGADALALCRDLAAAVPTIVQLDARTFTEENVGAALGARATA